MAANSDKKTATTNSEQRTAKTQRMSYGLYAVFYKLVYTDGHL
jgi:hypothetical protein